MLHFPLSNNLVLFLLFSKVGNRQRKEANLEYPPQKRFYETRTMKVLMAKSLALGLLCSGLALAEGAVSGGALGGFQDIDDTCNHPELLHAASFAANNYCTSVLAKFRGDVNCDDIKFEVIRASYQVVAGMNFKGTVALADDQGECVSAFSGNIYVPLLSTEERPRVDELNALKCSDVEYQGKCSRTIAEAEALAAAAAQDAITNSTGTSSGTEDEKDGYSSTQEIGWKEEDLEVSKAENSTMAEPARQENPKETTSKATATNEDEQTKDGEAATESTATTSNSDNGKVDLFEDEIPSADSTATAQDSETEPSNTTVAKAVSSSSSESKASEDSAATDSPDSSGNKTTEELSGNSPGSSTSGENATVTEVLANPETNSTSSKENASTAISTENSSENQTQPTTQSKMDNETTVDVSPAVAENISTIAASSEGTAQTNNTTEQTNNSSTPSTPAQATTSTTSTAHSSGSFVYPLASSGSSNYSAVEPQNHPGTNVTSLIEVNFNSESGDLEISQATSTPETPGDALGEFENEILEEAIEDAEDESTWTGGLDRCRRFGDFDFPAAGVLFKCGDAAYICGDSIEFREKFLLLMQDPVVESCNIGEVHLILSARKYCNKFPKNEHYLKRDGKQKPGEQVICPNGEPLESYFMFCNGKTAVNYFCDGHDCETCAGVERRRHFLRH
jgi:hypothetical protein